MALLLPQRPRLVQARTKPLGRVQVDRTHPLANGLIGFWPLNEGDGRRVTDAVNGLTGLGGVGSSWVGTVYGPGLAFSGVSTQEITGGGLHLRGSTSATFLVGYRITADVDLQYFWRWGSVNGTRQAMHVCDAYSNSNRYRMFSDDHIMSWGIKELGVRQQIAITHANTSIVLYRNGRQAGTSTAGGAFAGNGDWTIGGAFGAYFAGTLDYVAAFNRALSAEEVALWHAEPFGVLQSRPQWFVLADAGDPGGPEEKSGTDTQSVTGTEAATLSAAGSATDSQPLSATETTALAASVAASDTQALAATETAALAANLDATDTQAITGAESGSIEQVALPDADVNAGAWTTHTGGTTNLYAAINDYPSADDGTYIQSPLAPAGAVYAGSLGPIIRPDIRTGHTIAWRIGKDAPGGDRIDAILRVYDGASLIATFTRTDVDALTTYTETLTESEAEMISDYSSLTVTVEAVQV
jgi:hypothetical protein